MRTLRRLLAAAAPALAATGLVMVALAAAALPASAVVVDGIAAIVNGEVITLFELEKAGRLALEERLPSAPAAEQERLRREVLSAVLDELVAVRIQAQRARQLGILISPQEIDAAIAEVREQNRMSEELLERVLQERGATLEQYRRDIEDQLRLKKLVQREIRAGIAATDQEVASWYAEHRQDWFRPEMIRVRHLLVPLPPSASAGETATARAKAQALLAAAGEGANFADLVRAETPGAAADFDPVSGQIARGELFSELEQVAFALPVGGVGGPVQGPAGFHVVQVVEKTPAFEPKLDDIRESIEQKIVDQKTRDRFQGWLKRLRAEATVEIRY